MPWPQLSMKCGAGSTGKAMATALKEGYGRRVARKKPVLTSVMRTKRLKWAQEMARFSRDDWRKALWTDESSMAIDRPHRRHKNRRVSQAYHPQCVQPKFRHSIKVMIRGSISGHGLELMVIWEKEWGNVTAKSYCEHTVPVVEAYLSGFSDIVFMHDLTPGHNAALMRSALSKAGLVVLTWPSNSPDLNPIEPIWQDIK